MRVNCYSGSAGMTMTGRVIRGHPLACRIKDLSCRFLSYLWLNRIAINLTNLFGFYANAEL